MDLVTDKVSFLSIVIDFLLVIRDSKKQVAIGLFSVHEFSDDHTSVWEALAWLKSLLF